MLLWWFEWMNRCRSLGTQYENLKAIHDRIRPNDGGDDDKLIRQKERLKTDVSNQMRRRKGTDTADSVNTVRDNWMTQNGCPSLLFFVIFHNNMMIKRKQKTKKTNGFISAVKEIYLKKNRNLKTIKVSIPVCQIKENNGFSYLWSVGSCMTHYWSRQSENGTRKHYGISYCLVLITTQSHIW
jgi:hypothetical protein